MWSSVPNVSSSSQSEEGHAEGDAMDQKKKHTTS